MFKTIKNFFFPDEYTKIMGRRYVLLSLVPYSIRYWWIDRVRPIYAPQHEELRKIIPKTWSDLDYIITEFLYACVISYVEGEGGLEHWKFQSQWPDREEKVAMLEEIYNFAKAGRKELLKRIDDAHPPLPKNTDIMSWLNNPHRLPFEEEYKDVLRLEKELEEKDERYLQWIVNNRGNLWT